MKPFLYHVPSEELTGVQVHKIGGKLHAGLLADLLEALMTKHNFTVQILEPADRQYGNLDKSSGNWTGTDNLKKYLDSSHIWFCGTTTVLALIQG